MLKESSKSLITPVVADAVSSVLTEVHTNGKDVNPSATALIEREGPVLFALSPYLMNTAVRYPQALYDFIDDGALEPDWQLPCVADIKLSIEKLDTTTDEEAQMKALRLVRHAQLMRILWRDITGVADLDETLQQLSTLADACVQAACDWSEQAMHERFGIARDDDGVEQRLIVLGMGKLGGYELNVSSDIDLIYVFARAGKSDGKKVLDNTDYFTRVAQRITRMLGSVTADGFVYRVDTRLRPFGESGPLVMNLNGLEQYYLTQGRDWERYAMVKARAITGNTDDIAELFELLQPFVYRRYLDYSAIDSLRQLKRKISLSVVQRGMQDNIKLGSGGIREIEFIGQVFQLVRGGRMPELQDRSIKAVLNTLIELDLMEASLSASLTAAYDFLRRVENALQAMHDKQVHSLPSAADSDDRLRLIGIVGFADWEQFGQALCEHQLAVSKQFEALFADPDEQVDEHDENKLTDPVSDAALRTWAIVSSMDADQQSSIDAINDFGIKADDELLENINGLCKGAFYARLTARGQDRLDDMLPRLFDAVLEYDDPDTNLLRCLRLMRAVAGRSGYVQILIERPHAFDRLVRLFSRSAWAAQFVTRHPIVIDELLRYDRSTALTDLETLCAEAMAEAERAKDWELDEQMDALRHFKQARELRIAVAELDHDIPLMQVSDQLSWLAQALLHAVLHLVENQLQKKHGKPSCINDGEKRTPSVCLVAYGKLGGLELGYGSDLDVVFLHDSSGEKQQTDGAKSIDNGQYFGRLAQKVVHFMNTQTPAGLLYDVDLRLRPNGQSGVLVTSLDSFTQYQQSEAWTWEHQALVRTRVLVGPVALQDRFNEVRQQVLCLPRDTQSLRAEVVDMRQRMRDSLEKRKSGYIHLKQASGGIADIEFIVQYLVLANAAQYPELCRFSDNIRILEQTVEAGLLAQSHAKTLIECYLSLRKVQHRQSLQLQSALVKETPDLLSIRQRVETLWQEILLV